MKTPWCVKHKDGWCALPLGKQPDPHATSDETVCGHQVIFRLASAKCAPTCPECIAALQEKP